MDSVTGGAFAENLAWLKKRWPSFWFAPSLPEPLGICRIIFFGGLLALSLRSDPSRWSGVSPVFWMPIPLFERLHLPVLSAGALRTMDIVWKLSLILSALGCLTRASTGTAFILGIYLLGLSHNFGKTNHADALIVLSMAVLALSRSGDAYSVDAVRLSRARVVSGEYTWPVRAIWLLMVLVFFGAGISKLAGSGIAWVLSDNLQNLILVHQVTHASPVDWGVSLASHPDLCRLLALAAVGAEVLAPLALFSIPARVILIPALLLMQAGIAVLLGVVFTPFLLCYPFWIPWNRVVRA